MKSRTELIRELDETQRFLNTCELAQAYGLGLDEATYTRYTDSLKRQQELAEAIREMEASPSGIRTTACFLCKEPQIKSVPCIIEKTIELDDEAFSYFSTNLLRDHDILAENCELMYVDSHENHHCLLILGKGRADGILVQSEGYDCARYTALLPNARSLIQQQGNPLTLRRLLDGGLEDVHLVNPDEGGKISTAVNLDAHTLTKAGLTEWADVLDAQVGCIKEGFYGAQIELTGCPAERLAAFAYLLAGYGVESDYAKWVNEAYRVQDNGPVLTP